MKKSYLKIILLAFAIAVFIPLAVSAHQPRLVTQNPTVITDPEISKAYYGQLPGGPAIYTISSDKPFHLYVNVLVPDIAGQKKDVSAVIVKKGTPDETLATLDGTTFEWKKMFEEFGHDNYWQGPEYKNEVSAGNYEIRVFGPANTSLNSAPNNIRKYSLATGEIEKFDFKESVNALKLIPQIKRDFFEESPISFILSPFGIGYIVIMFVLAFIIGFIYRALLLKFTKVKTLRPKKNINRSGRLLRAAIGVILLLIAITTSWNPIVLFFAGFCFFEAIFSWCGVFAAIGKNTCPTK
jgi:hypothetical protein